METVCGVKLVSPIDVKVFPFGVEHRRQLQVVSPNHVVLVSVLVRRSVARLKSNCTSASGFRWTVSSWYHLTVRCVSCAQFN